MDWRLEKHKDAAIDGINCLTTEIERLEAIIEEYEKIVVEKDELLEEFLEELKKR